MSSQVLFNQFAYTDRLKAGGFTDDQARASAEALGAALSETVATKNDITDLRHDLGAKIAESQATMIKWFVGISLTMTGLISTAVWAIVKLSH